jgi:hypothetical protein
VAVFTGVNGESSVGFGRTFAHARFEMYPVIQGCSGSELAL